MAAKTKVVIYMLRNDLRIHANEALIWANNHGTHLLPVYCIDPRHYEETHTFGFPKTGYHRLKFLLESVQDLRQSLRNHGSGLVVRHGKPEVVIPELIETLGRDVIEAIIFQEEATKEELDVENALRQNCGDKIIKTVWNHTLYHRDDLPFTIPQLPDVFTEFRKQVEGLSRVRHCVEMPSKFNPLPEGMQEGDIPNVESFGFHDRAPDPRNAFPFLGGETYALARLHHYLWETDAVATYKETRNGMIGTEYSTKFSPWLALGCLSARKVFYEIKKYERERTVNQSTYWVIFELLWRDYFRFVALKYGNRIFYLSGIKSKNIQWKQDQHLFNAWKDGKTGIPYIDANMRELATTGFISNRGRQNVASFLTKDLKLDWRMGAEWFESMLIDHDVCSNYGNWLYCAGIGNDPRSDRKFNIVKQALDYDPQGEFVRLWVPELKSIAGGAVHTVWRLSKSVLSKAGVLLRETYPEPMVVAPEWSRYGRVGGQGAQGHNGPGETSKSSGQKRGIDFYFKK